ncbi:MAG: hypothetical protein HFE63_06335 [Clostridiales bacterium]|nr:hypothetical protein [Clostridiales bacterium]
MKKLVGFAVAVIMSVMCAISVSADSPSPEGTINDVITTEPVVTDTSHIDNELSEIETKNKTVSAVLLLSTVSGALVVIALIYRGRDKGKYL